MILAALRRAGALKRLRALPDTPVHVAPAAAASGPPQSTATSSGKKPTIVKATSVAGQPASAEAHRKATHLPAAIALDKKAVPAQSASAAVQLTGSAAPKELPPTAASSKEVSAAQLVSIAAQSAGPTVVNEAAPLAVAASGEKAASAQPTSVESKPASPPGPKEAASIPAVISGKQATLAQPENVAMHSVASPPLKEPSPLPRAVNQQPIKVAALPAGSKSSSSNDATSPAAALPDQQTASRTSREASPSERPVMLPKARPANISVPEGRKHYARRARVHRRHHARTTERNAPLVFPLIAIFELALAPSKQLTAKANSRY